MNIHGVFDTLNERAPHTSLTVPDTWRQGRTTFGGLVTVLGLAAMRRRVPADRPLRNLLVAFVGPSGTGSLTSQANVLRQGRSVTHARADVLTPDGEICATLHGCFGESRVSSLSRNGHTAPAWPRPEALTELPFMEGLAPSFTQYLRYCWAEGPYPYEGKPEGAYGGWISCHGERREATEAHLVTFMDAWPSPSLSMLTTLAPASTLSWNLELFHTGAGFATTDWWQFKTHVDTAGDGYVSEEAKLWTPDGQLAGISRQAVTVFG